MVDEIYRINISVQQFETDGFWDLSNSIEMGKTKNQLIESLDKCYKNAKDYIEKRL